MDLSRSLVLVPFLSFALAAAVASGACASSVTVETPPGISDPPEGLFVRGVSFGGPCFGEVYLPASVGWAICNDGSWAYTEVDPADEGYALDSALESASASGVEVNITVPTPDAPPVGLVVAGVTFGGACDGDVYVTAGVGFAFCDDGVWAYTDEEPGDGYTIDSAVEASSGSGFSEGFFSEGSASSGGVFTEGSASSGSGATLSIGPVVSTAPAGLELPGGIAIGGFCDGDVYVTAGAGWVFCDDGVWEYTTDDPASDGYTLDTEG